MKRTVLLLTLLINAPLPGHASYRGEAALNYGESDGDSRNFGLNLSWFVDPLTAGGPEPWAESAFVERPRTLSLGINRSEIELSRTTLIPVPDGNGSGEDPNDIPSPDMRRTSYELDYTHRAASSPHVFTVGTQYTRVSSTSIATIVGPDTPPSYVITRSDHDGHGVSAGYRYHLQPRLALGIRILSTWQDSGNQFADVETRNLGADLSARWLMALGGDRWLALSGGVAHTEMDMTVRPVNGSRFDRSDRTTSYYGSATIYMSRRTSVAVSGNHQPDLDLSSATVSVRHFFNDRVSLGAAATRTFPDQGKESMSYSGNLTCRL